MCRTCGNGMTVDLYTLTSQRDRGEHRHVRRSIMKGILCRRIATYAALLILVACPLPGISANASVVNTAPAPIRVTMSFDAGWRFQKGDAVGSEKPEYDDAAWRALDVPHDWS